MSPLHLEISEDILHSLKLPGGEVEGELRRELALALYQRGALTLGKARQLADMSRWEFESLLGQRRIMRHYGKDDLTADLTYADRDR